MSQRAMITAVSQQRAHSSQLCKVWEVQLDALCLLLWRLMSISRLKILHSVTVPRQIGLLWHCWIHGECSIYRFTVDLNIILKSCHFYCASGVRLSRDVFFYLIVEQFACNSWMATTEWCLEHVNGGSHPAIWSSMTVNLWSLTFNDREGW